jgi:hypothetical protein
VPFIEILYRAEVDEDVVVAIRDALHRAVGVAFEDADPDHPVTAAMVDLRCIAVGPLDVVRPDVLITVLARTEPARHARRSVIAEQLARVVGEVAPDLDVMLEIVLTDRTSAYEYP